MRKICLVLALLLAFVSGAGASEILLEQGFENIFPPIGWTIESTSAYTWASC